jgi:murein L,D-transpeptidase YcbB/YkuD
MFAQIKWSLILTLVCSMALANESIKPLQQFTELLATGSEISAFNEPIHAKTMVSEFYRLRQYQPAWTNKEHVVEVLQALGDSYDEGLLPDDYHYQVLLTLYKNGLQEVGISNSEQAEFELLMTDGVLMYALHLIHGKLDPANLADTWNYKRRELLPEKAISELEKNVESGTVASALNSLKPQIQLYKKIRNGLALYRQIEQEHPFFVIEPTPLLKPEELSSVVPAIRQRLITMRFLDENEATSEIYDDNLVKAVKAFQLQHGMDTDGVVGKQTWQALNMSWQERIDKIRVNLERTRWVYENASDNFVLVNIAGFNMYLIKDKKVAWKTAVMTGKIGNETPLFMSRFNYMELNPTWTVPRSILRKSMINKIKANPQYLIEHDFVLLDRQGKEVDSQTLDWSTLSRNNFPYTVVQQPGDLNALGQVKFIFPNKYSIYLHDTPSKTLFSRSARAFSHGCVRVQEPLELARLLANDPDIWTQEKIAGVVASKKRTRVKIKTPTDVMLMYWTTEPYANNNIKFNPDIYNRDPSVLAALNETAFDYMKF